MAQALSPRLVAEEARFQSQVNQCAICVGQSDAGRGCTLVFSLSVSFHQCPILIFTYMMLLPEGKTGETWEFSKKSCCSGNEGALDMKVFLLSSYNLKYFYPI
jgi:hypothetical protein